MPNHNNQMAPKQELQVLKLIEANEITVEEGLQYLQVHQPSPGAEGSHTSQSQPQEPAGSKPRKATVLRVKVIDGDSTKVNVVLPLGLVRWSAKTVQTTLNAIAPTILPHALARLAKEINPKSAESIGDNLENLDVDAICDAIIEGLDQLEGVGPFDFVTVEDGDTTVQIGIE